MSYDVAACWQTLIKENEMPGWKTFITIFVAVVALVITVFFYGGSKWETIPLSQTPYTLSVERCNQKPGEPTPVLNVTGSYNSFLHLSGDLSVAIRVNGKAPVTYWDDLSNEDASVSLADRSWNPSSSPTIHGSIVNGDHPIVCTFSAQRK